MYTIVAILSAFSSQGVLLMPIAIQRVAFLAAYSSQSPPFWPATPSHPKSPTPSSLSESQLLDWTTRLRNVPLDPLYQQIAGQYTNFHSLQERLTIILWSHPRFNPHIRPNNTR